MTDTPERELIEQLRAFAYQLSRCSEITLGKQDCAETSTGLTQAADTIEALLSRIDKLEERLTNCFNIACDYTICERDARSEIANQVRIALNRSAS